jgi:hypothetical protein
MHARFAKAFKDQWCHNVFVGESKIRIAFLIREEDWRPLYAWWWRDKQVSVIGADVDGNFFLRHPSGSVLYWEHKKSAAETLAKSVDEFAAQINEGDYSV